MPAIHDPGGLGHKIDTMWVWVISHGDDDESVMGMIGSNGAAFPLVFAKPELVDKARPHVEDAVRATGKPARLIKFVTREVVEQVG